VEIVVSETVRELPWFRFYKDAVDDAKLRSISKEDRWDFVALLCCKAQGLLDGNADQARMRRMVCVKLGVDGITLDEIERRLVEAFLIEPKTLQPLAWDKRQYKSDSSAERTRNYRKRHRDCADTDTEEDTEKEKNTYTPEFEAVWQSYPDRPGVSKAGTFKAWKARIREGASVEQMAAGVARYASYCKAMQTEPIYIKQPKTFFGPDLHYQETWVAPARRVTRQDERASMHAGLTNTGEHDARSSDANVIDV
jgi:hypothetical protein